MKGSLGKYVRDVHTSSAASAPAPDATAAGAPGTGTEAKRSVFVKVGDSKYLPFATDVTTMNVTTLLEALAASKVFGVKLKDVDLSACTVEFVTLPSGKQLLTAAEEKNAKFEELEGAMTVSAVAASITTGGEQVCIRVQLPAAAAVLPSFPALPAPITFTRIAIDGQRWFVTRLAQQDGVTVPVFLTAAQHGELARFINERPSRRPQALMPVGTIKSGKTTIVEELLPGMIAAAVAARWPSTRKRPVLFNYKFPLGGDAEAAAMHFSRALLSFGQRISVPFKAEATGGDALDNLPTNIREFATRIRDAAGPRPGLHARGGATVHVHVQGGEEPWGHGMVWDGSSSV